MKMIYGISGPDDRIVYIGSSKNDLKYILSHHRTSARAVLTGKGKATPLKNWINEVGLKNFTVEILEYVEVEDLEDRMAYWLDYCKANSIPLLNVTKEQQLEHLRKVMADPEVRRKMVENRPKRRERPEGWVKPERKKTGRTISEEHKEIVRRTHTGKVVSEETRRKIAEKALGHKRNAGRVHSEASKLKMSHTKHVSRHEKIAKFDCRWCMGDELEVELQKLP